MKIELNGIDKVIASFNKVDKKFEKQVDTAIQGALLRAVSMARNRLQPMPGDPDDIGTDMGAVRQSINFTYDPTTKTGGFFAGNVQGEHLAAYYAFGTGKHAKKFVSTLPEPFQKMAMGFYVNGKGVLQTHDYFVFTFLQEGERLKDKLKNLKVGW